MIVGIDASNIRIGGGITHLCELLRAAHPRAYKFNYVILWCGSELFEKIENQEWLCKVYEPLLDRGLHYRIFWHCFKLKKLAKKAGCDILFVPGGSDASCFKPMVTMSQNLLPFEWREMRRFGWSLYTIKFLLLRWVQSHSFRKAAGIIFLTNHARGAVLNVTGSLRGRNIIIPHGINPRFFIYPRKQLQPKEFNYSRPCKVLYVSSVDAYKHQWQVAIAISQLRAAGVPIMLELIGPPAKGIKLLNKTLNRIDPEGGCINYRGAVPYEDLHNFYKEADIGIFASSCENMPNILLEGMAAGLPMACSCFGPMPEVLGNAGVYFMPEDPVDIAGTLRMLFDSAELREKLAQEAFDLAQQYSWKRCADETFDFLAEIAHNEI